MLFYTFSFNYMALLKNGHVGNKFDIITKYIVDIFYNSYI